MRIITNFTKTTTIKGVIPHLTLDLAFIVSKILSFSPNNIFLILIKLSILDINPLGSTSLFPVIYL